LELLRLLLGRMGGSLDGSHLRGFHLRLLAQGGDIREPGRRGGHEPLLGLSRGDERLFEPAPLRCEPEL